MVSGRVSAFPQRVIYVSQTFSATGDSDWSQGAVALCVHLTLTHYRLYRSVSFMRLLYGDSSVKKGLGASCKIYGYSELPFFFWLLDGCLCIKLLYFLPEFGKQFLFSIAN